MKSEIQHRASFDRVRYAQCWEDADVLVAALQPKGRRCVSIGSAGDNSFSLLAEGAEYVVAVEMNPAQIACIELRRAAYLQLEHGEFLALIGSRPCDDRMAIYEKCKNALDKKSRAFWDARTPSIIAGIGSAGKFEDYFSLFRHKVLPVAHNHKRVQELLRHKPRNERDDYYASHWNNLRWRMIFRVFFSRFVMGRLGRDPEFFQYVEGSVAERILMRTRHALTVLEPAQNPYLHWILNGTHGEALPHALRKESFYKIKHALARDGSFRVIEAPLEKFLAEEDNKYDAYNLSDIFEYMGEQSMRGLLGKIVSRSAPGARLAYWNMLAPRHRPDDMAAQLLSLDEEAAQLFLTDKAWFYSRFVLEEVVS